MAASPATLQTIMVTRRFLATVFDAAHLVPRCELAPLRNREEGHLFNQLLDMLKFYSAFEINDFTGTELSEPEMIEKHYSYIGGMQVRLCHGLSVTSIRRCCSASRSRTFRS